MDSTIPIEKCRSFLDSQWQASLEAPTSTNRRATERPAITLSRATGSGALSIAAKLADYLQRQTSESEPA